LRVVEAQILPVIDRVYEASVDTSAWPTALAEMAALVNAPIASFLSMDRATVDADIHAFFGVSQEMIEQYLGGYDRLDILASDAMQRPAGIIYTEQSYPDPQIYYRSQVCNEFFLPNEATHLLGTIPIKDAARGTGIAFRRSERAGPFGPTEIALFEHLIPHLRRALQVYRQLTEVATLKTGIEAALDRIWHGVVLIDESGRILHMNKAAGAIVAQRDGLSACHRLLGARCSGEADRLHKLIAEASRSGGGGGAMRVARPSGSPAYELLIGPLPTDTLSNGNGRGAIVFIRDPRNPPPPDLSRLIALHGLTTAEARLAAALAEGHCLDEIAARFNISVCTARTQLKQVFDKFGVRRQAEVVSRIVASLTMAP
jgi:DNA-binding CsgD family transcriptional regulator